ncbi:MAG: TolC family protein [Gemmataceae bacterium]|nr:TolC family protein [Gemmataceae bacterium]
MLARNFECTIAPLSYFKSFFLGMMLVGMGGLCWAEAAQIEKPVKVPVFSLAQLQEMGRASSPLIKAAQAGVDGVAEKQSAIHKMRFLGLISKEIPVRKQQAEAGAVAASASFSQSELDVNFSVAYTYTSIIYARQQLEIADRGITDLTTTGDIAREIVKTGSRNDVSKKQIDQINVYHNFFYGRKEEAVQGIPRAKAGLREAIGIQNLNWDLEPADKVLTLPEVSINKEEMVRLAVERRSEIQLAQAAVDVTCLEVQAQQKIWSLTGRTFATGTDIHAILLPAPSFNEDYKPGAIAPEMPANLVGSRRSRAAQAQILHTRAEAVSEKARSLVALEAETTWLRWVENQNRAKHYLKAADEAEKLAASLKDRFDPRGGKITLDEVIDSGIQANTMRIQANEVVYKTHLSLIALERVTAGGFKAPPITKK